MSKAKSLNFDLSFKYSIFSMRRNYFFSREIAFPDRQHPVGIKNVWP